jgi:hypothetical protein
MHLFFGAFLVVGSLAAAASAGDAISDGHGGPSSIHLALARAPEDGNGVSDYAMVASWSTDFEAESILFYGTDRHFLSERAHGSSTQYTYEPRIPTQQLYVSPVLHHATTGALLPSTKYYYRVGDEALGISALQTFTTPPAVGAPGMSFAVVGDVGQTEDSMSTLSSLLQEVHANSQLALLLHPGDISYADCQQPLWDYFMEHVASPLASSLPWMVAPGNHEAEVEVGTGLAFTAFEARFDMPAVMDAKVKAAEAGRHRPDECAPSDWSGHYDGGNAFYSFDAGPVHFISLNSYTDHGSASAQYQWLSKDLDSVDRRRTPWVVAQYHCPWYSSNSDHQLEPQTLHMRESMESLLKEAGVAVTFAGHVHAYERTHPISEWQRSLEGSVHITIGVGGNHEGHANKWLPRSSWSAFRDSESFGYGIAHVRNSTHLEWEWFGSSGHCELDGAYTKKDSAWIVNPYQGPLFEQELAAIL